MAISRRQLLPVLDEGGRPGRHVRGRRGGVLRRQRVARLHAAPERHLLRRAERRPRRILDW